MCGGGADVSTGHASIGEGGEAKNTLRVHTVNNFGLLHIDQGNGAEAERMHV